MSRVNAIFSRDTSLVVQSKVQYYLLDETRKGCDPQLSHVPVALEPPFNPIVFSDIVQNKPDQLEVVYEIIPPKGDLSRFQVWISPGEEPSWLKSEFFLKQLSTISHRIGFEIIGNKEKIHIGFLVYKDDLPVLETSFRGSFQHCELTEVSCFDAFNSLNETGQLISFIDSFPSPPYVRLLTRPEELKISPYQPLIAALMNIEPPDLGFYQALFQPVQPQHNWHKNVEILLDIEYGCKLMSNPLTQKVLQQVPSADLRHMANNVETKSHNDKPFYFFACRIGAISSNNPQRYLKSLATFFNLFQHGGRPMQFITDHDYRLLLSNDEIADMFRLGLTYRLGFLVNSSELSGLVHIPQADILGFRTPNISLINNLPVQNLDIHQGTPLGTYEYTGKIYPVCIPPYYRVRSTHIIGRPGTGKSTVLLRMALDDIIKGVGVAVLDPHGDLIDDLMCCIPYEHIGRTVLFDLTIPGYVPIWNPLCRSKGEDISRKANDLLGAFKKVFQHGWGDRMGYLLAHGLYALSHIHGSTLHDLERILSKRDKKRSIQDEPLLQRILKVLDNDIAEKFWQYHINNYESAAFDPPRHRLDKILLSGNAGLMLSQPDSLIDFRQIMDEGKILLVKLSLIGSEITEILGCFMLSLLHLAAIGRADTAIARRRPFQIYLDEAHRFISDTLENLITDIRKFEVGATMAHQFLSQFGNTKIDALSSVGTTIIMNIDRRDAGYLVKDLREEVTPNDLINLKTGEAVVRINTDIAKINTLGPLKKQETHFKDQIIQHSLRHYYRPEKVVKKMIREKTDQNIEFAVSLTGLNNYGKDKVEYDELKDA